MSFRPTLVTDDAPIDPFEDEILADPEKILENMRKTMPPAEYEVAALRYRVQLAETPEAMRSAVLFHFAWPFRDDAMVGLILYEVCECKTVPKLLWRLAALLVMMTKWRLLERFSRTKSEP